MHRATDELKASRIVERALKAGNRTPEFSLNDADGHAVSSRDLLANGPLVVTFLPPTYRYLIALLAK
jgi:hypothetical protein